MEGSRHILVCITLLVSAVLIAPTEAVGPWCFRCADAFHPAICQNVIQCGDHELCHTEVKVSNNGANLYSTSCKADSDCTTRIRKRAVSRITLCSECCSGTLCNVEGCKAPQIRTPGRLFCLNCDFVQNPADCDTADLCSQDQVCHASIQQRFGLNFYKLGCLAKTSCPAASATLAKDKSICCDTDLCNSNDLGINPALYTTTPVPTTRLPSPATASFDSKTLVYNVTHAPNETMDLVCNVTGGPVPQVTWTFDDGNGSVAITQGISTGPTGYTSILSVPSPDKSSSGMYTCKAENANGKSEDNVVVTVLEPPQIEGSLNQTMDLQVQDDVTLPCKINGDNSTTSKWVVSPQIKSYKINADNSLTLFNVHGENTGDYTCVAENADGKVEKIFHIVVNDTMTSSSPAPCTCPTVQPLSALTTPTTTTVQTVATQMTTSPLTTPTSTIPTSTIPTSTIPTSTTPTSTTPMSTTPKSTTSASTTPTTTATPLTTLTTTSTPSTTASAIISASTTTQPMVSGVPNQFQDSKAGQPVSVMQCPTASGTPSPGVTWHRLVQDFNHTDPAFYDNNNGVLTIVSQMTVLMTGVYECSEGGVPRAQFVIYDKLQNPVQCNNVFGDFTPTRGAVIRVTCGPCANPLGVRPNLQVKTSDFICESAIAKKLIHAYGGDVTYLIKDNNEVALIDEHAGNIVVT